MLAQLQPRSVPEGRGRASAGRGSARAERFVGELRRGRLVKLAARSGHSHSWQISCACTEQGHHNHAFCLTLHKYEFRLRGARLGSIIDRHEAVFRFNNASVAPPWSDDVGSRTTLWLSTHAAWRRRQTEAATTRGADPAVVQNVLYCFNPWVGRCHEEVLLAAQQQRPKQGRRVPTTRGGRPRSPRSPRSPPPLPLSPLAQQQPLQQPLQPPRAVLLLNPHLVGLLAALQRQLGGARRGSVRPSTGLVGLALALRVCRRVSLFGFANASDPRELRECDHCTSLASIEPQRIARTIC